MRQRKINLITFRLACSNVILSLKQARPLDKQEINRTMLHKIAGNNNAATNNSIVPINHALTFLRIFNNDPKYLRMNMNQNHTHIHKIGKLNMRKRKCENGKNNKKKKHF